MKNGFALLLSLIVTSILLVVGLGVSGVAFREIQLSGFGNQSEIAFYAAETGLECALYWDKVVTDPTDSNGDGSLDDEPSAFSAFVIGSDNLLGGCLENSISFMPGYDFIDPSNLATKFNLNFGASNQYVEVEVKKEFLNTGDPDKDDSLVWAKTFITSTGYNTSDFSDPRRVGRALELELNLAP